MSTPNVLLVVLVVAFLAASLASPDAAAQQQRPELPDNVKEWLARDQLQRWARLLESGEELFSDGTCYRCHGQGGTEGRFGPDLTDQEWVQSDGSLAGIRETIMWGVRKRDLSDPTRPFMLPSGGMQLAWEDLDAVTAYVWSLSNGTYLPER